MQSALESATAAQSAIAKAVEQQSSTTPDQPAPTQFADTLDMPMPATLTKERPYLRALGKGQSTPPERESA